MYNIYVIRVLKSSFLLSFVYRNSGHVNVFHLPRHVCPKSSNVQDTSKGESGHILGRETIDDE